MVIILQTRLLLEFVDSIWLRVAAFLLQPDVFITICIISKSLKCLHITWCMGQTIHQGKQHDVKNTPKVQKQPPSAFTATKITIPPLKHKVNDDGMIKKLQTHTKLTN